MDARTLPFPHLWRRLLAPTAAGLIGAAAAAVIARLRRVGEPRLPRMSEEWLRNFDATDRPEW